MRNVHGLGGAAAFALAALLAGALACGTSGDGGPGDGSDDCIGPEGATYAIDDPGSAADGVRVTVPPGSREGCWGLIVNSAFFFRFPNGFKSYREGTAFDLAAWGEKPAVIELEISVPIEDMTPPGPMRMLAAFWTDPEDESESWHVVPPDAFDGQRMIMRTTKKTTGMFEQWSWGRVALDVVDYQASLAAGVEEMYGSRQWAAVSAELRRIQESELSDLAFDCRGLDAVRSVFGAMMQQAEPPLLSYQESLAGACRSCDVTNAAVLADFVEYVRLNALAWFWEEVFLETDGVIRIVALIRLMGSWDQLSSLSCDWECYFANAYDDCDMDLTIYWLSWIAVDLADWGARHLGCP